MVSVVTSLDLKNPDGSLRKPFVIGDDMQAQFRKILRFLTATKNPIDLVGDPGTGKCVAATELLTMADGSRVVAGDLVGQSFTLLTLDDGKIVRVEAHAEINAVETVYEVITESGRRIVRNGQHPLYTANIDRKLNTTRASRVGRGISSTHRMRVNGWTPVQDIQIGDLVAVTQELPAFPYYHGADLSDTEIKVLAYMIGDGSYHQPGLRFTQQDNDQLAEFRGCVEDLGCELVYHTEYTYRIVGEGRGSSSKNAIVHLLKEHGMTNTVSRDKHLPDVVWSFDRRQLALFLSRLYSTDGWAYSGPAKNNRQERFQIGYCSTSKQLIEELQEALIRLGIASVISAKYEKKFGVQSWTLDISRPADAVAFADTVGIYGKEQAVKEVRRIAVARIENNTSSVWRVARTEQGTLWEKVQSVTVRGIEETIAIEVPATSTYLTAFYEHNSHLGLQLCLAYAVQNNCNAYITQVDEETMRSTLFGGLRFAAGEHGGLDEESFLAVCGRALQDGDIVFIDELTHGIPSIQTSFNRATDKNASLSVGDLLIQGHPRARFVFGHNRTRHSGNYGLKPSFASRLFAFEFTYPAAKTEAQIAKNIARQSLGEELAHELLPGVPDGIIRMLTSWAREVRDITGNMLPVSARNVAAMVEMLALLPRKENSPLPDEWNVGTAGEPIRRKMAERVFFTNQLESDADLHHQQVNQAMQFIADIGKDDFKQAVLGASMYYLDIEGIASSIMDRWRETMVTSII